MPLGTVSCAVDFLHTLGHDETFWAGLAAVQAALMIALVVEGSNARREWEASERALDADLARRGEAAEEHNRKIQQDERSEIAPTGRRELVVARNQDPNQDERAGRITMALAVVPALGMGLLASLFAMSPIAYPGGLVVALGAAWSAAVTVGAVLVLAAMATRRLSGQKVRELLKSLVSR
jgi:hypothetical protein